MLDSLPPPPYSFNTRWRDGHLSGHCKGAVMPNEVWTPQQDGIIRGLRASLYQLRTVVTTLSPTPQSSEAIIETSLYDGTLFFGLDGSWEEGYLLVNNDGYPLTNQEGLPVFDRLRSA